MCGIRAGSRVGNRLRLRGEKGSNVPRYNNNGERDNFMAQADNHSLISRNNGIPKRFNTTTRKFV